MSFSSILKKMISDSNLSFKEISEKCKITPSYISKLANDKISPPSDEVCIKIAEACNADANILILEAYLEKAPKVLTDFLDNIRIQFGAMSFKTKNNEKTLNNDIYKQLTSDEPLSKFITDFNFQNISDINITDRGILVKDDSMEPLIPKGSYVTIKNFKDNPTNTFKLEKIGISDEDKKLCNELYNDEVGFLYAQDGDIVVAWDLNNNKLLIRTYQNIEDYDLEYFLLPMNGRYKIGFHSLDHTYYNLAHFNNNKELEFNNKLIDYIKREEKYIIDGEEVTIQEPSFGVCILGKVDKIIKNI